METKGKEVYDAHLESVRKSFHRKGVSGLENETEINTAGYLETIIRVSEPTNGVLSDLNNKAFSSDGYDELRKRYFQDYLEYRKLFMEVPLEEYLGTRYGLDVADEEPKVVIEEDLEDEEVYPEDLIEKTPNGSVVLYTIPYGVDSDGYDIWYDVDQESKILGKIDQFHSIKLPEISLVVDEEDKVVETADIFKSGLEYLPLGTDEDGYDIWKDPNFLREPLGVDSNGYDIWESEEEEIDLSEGLEDTPEFINTSESKQDQNTERELSGTWYGIDELGYDIWTSNESSSEDKEFAVEDDNDGFDHSEDEERDHLGELHSKWIGEDSNGYDIWQTGDDVDPSIADSSDPLGELKSTHYGTDSSGYDIWKPPVAQNIGEDSSVGVSQGSNTPSSNSSGIPSDRIVFTDRGAGSELHGHAPLSKEDQLLENVDKAISRVFGLGRKIAISRSRRNKV